MVRSLRTCRVAGVQVSPPANGVTGPRACVPGGPRPAFPEALQELLTARGSHAPPPARLPFFIQLVFPFVSEANVRGAALHWPEKEEALPRAHESSGAGFGVPRCMVPVTGMDFSDGSLHPDGPPGPLFSSSRCLGGRYPNGMTRLDPKIFCVISRSSSFPLGHGARKSHEIRALNGRNATWKSEPMNPRHSRRAGNEHRRGAPGWCTWVSVRKRLTAQDAAGTEAGRGTGTWGRHVPASHRTGLCCHVHSPESSTPRIVV